MAGNFGVAYLKKKEKHVDWLLSSVMIYMYWRMWQSRKARLALDWKATSVGRSRQWREYKCCWLCAPRMLNMAIDDKSSGIAFTFPNFFWSNTKKNEALLISYGKD